MVSASQSCFLNRKKMKQMTSSSSITFDLSLVFENPSEPRRPSCAEDAERKLNNIMLKVTPKLPVTLTASRAAHNVVLASPHRLLTKEEVGICTRKIQDHVNVMYMIEGSLEVKLPTIWTDEEQGRGREKRKIRREKSRRERVEEKD